MKKPDSFNLHKEVKDTTGLHKKHQQTFLVNDAGKIILVSHKKKDQCAQYIQELFNFG